MPSIDDTYILVVSNDSTYTGGIFGKYGGILGKYGGILGKYGGILGKYGGILEKAVIF